ncbi:PaaI family thioesterase [Amycolatopsis sp. K13G38]|uniref:PaaI family thioesterase n=1 Tax=Amycolatopsis acididurans TaxID=2724524 RepID=A0ABX1J6V1_9PSEU|nr:PaaI family thioesterase [Amycolatopsis acididurans]NKQ55463.1 PaaI family thioesterase [Amycolatopsis acididurans]
MHTVTSCHNRREFCPGGPELMFGVEDLTADGDAYRGVMTTGPWSKGPGNAAAVGVLADIVLGYALIASSPADRWSVSTEISLDFLGPLPSDGSLLTAEGRVVHQSPGTGLAEGSITTSHGRPLARCRQWGRFIEVDPAERPGEIPFAGPCRSAEELADTVGGTVAAADGRARISLSIEDDLVNPLRTLHGGITLWLAEFLAGRAVESVAGPLIPASLTVSYLRPLVCGDLATFSAEVTSSGRRLAVTQVTGVNQAGKPCIVALAHHHGAH